MAKQNHFHLSPRLAAGKKIFFASDFHLGAPNAEKSLIREKKLIAWLDEIAEESAAIFLMGDVFDFWFEYKYVIPKGFIRFQGKLAELRDRGIPIILFTGNHDMWMFDYFPKELGIPVYRNPVSFILNDQKFLIGHGDGLGPGDRSYKFLKRIFKSPICQWAFARLHPNFGIGLAKFWSGKSRSKSENQEQLFKGEEERLWAYCKEVHQKDPHQYYIFGHRHLPLDLPVGKESRYINLGEWLSNFSYAEFDGKKLELKYYKG